MPEPQAEPEPEAPALSAGEADALDRLKALDPDALTPRQALDLLYALRDRAREE